MQVSAASGAPLEHRAEPGRGEQGRGRAVAPRAAGPLPVRDAATRPGRRRRSQELARLHWSWLRFAPLTFSSVAGIGAVGAAVFNLLDDLGVDPRDIGVVDDATDRLAAAPIWFGLRWCGAALLVVAVVGALLLFAERWYGYRLTRGGRGGRTGGSTLRVKRGLLTRRSLSVAEQRLRGAEIVEPLLLRAGRGAQCRALSTGLSQRRPGRRAAAAGAAGPRRTGWRRRRSRADPDGDHLAALRRHPRAALLRRMTRALGPAAVAGAGRVLARAGRARLAWLGPASLVLLPVAALLGLGPLPQPRPPADRAVPGDPAGFAGAAHGRAAAGRGHRLDVPAERLPAPRRAGHPGGGDRGRRGRLPGARPRGGRRRRAGRRDHPEPADPVPRAPYARRADVSRGPWALRGPRRARVSRRFSSLARPRPG